MALNIDAKPEEKRTFAFKNDLRNFVNFHQSMLESLKIETLLGNFIQSRKCMGSKFTKELCFMTTKSDAKFEEELTCQLKTDMKNLTNFDPST